MKLDTNMLILLAAGGVGLYFLMNKNKQGGSMPGGLSAGDMAIMQAMAEQQAAASANQQAMMAIIQQAKQSGDPEKAGNPWTHPDTIVKFAELGISVAGMFV